MVLAESELSNRAAQESLPFRDAFSVLFFVSVGMLFDPTILLTRPLEVLATLFIVLVGKTVIGFFLVIALKRPVSSALTISASLAQIGEFSFILAGLGVGLGLMPPEGQSLILAAAIISIIANPIMMYFAEHFRPQLEARLAAAAPSIVVPDRVEPDMVAVAPPPVLAAEPEDERRPTRLTGHAVLIGYGRVGTVVADGLKRQGTPFVLIEDAEKRVAAAHAEGIEVVVGNAATSESLALANVAEAKTLLIAIPNAFEAGQAVEQCHKLNPGLLIVARAHSDEEVDYLQGLGANKVIMGEREIGLGMVGWTNGDAAHEVAVEQNAARLNAIASALELEPVPVEALPPEPALPETPPEVLEAEIEAAHPEHIITGPAEPPELVPALGEMPVETPPAAAANLADELMAALGQSDRRAEPEAVPRTSTKRADADDIPRPERPACRRTVAPAFEPEPELAPPAPEPDPDPAPPRPRAAGPATTPATPFNPEVAPAD